MKLQGNKKITLLNHGDLCSFVINGIRPNRKFVWCHDKQQSLRFRSNRSKYYLQSHGNL